MVLKAPKTCSAPTLFSSSAALKSDPPQIAKFKAADLKNQGLRYRFFGHRLVSVPMTAGLMGTARLRRSPRSSQKEKAWHLLNKCQAKVSRRLRLGQKINFIPNCMDRAGPALKILPVGTIPIVVFGLPRLTWLGMLNISQRNCRYLLSVM
jgi:hypothetical protein